MWHEKTNYIQINKILNKADVISNKNFFATIEKETINIKSIIKLIHVCCEAVMWLFLLQIAFQAVIMLCEHKECCFNLIIFQCLPQCSIPVAIKNKQTDKYTKMCQLY